MAHTYTHICMYITPCRRFFFVFVNNGLPLVPILKLNFELSLNIRRHLSWIFPTDHGPCPVFAPTGITLVRLLTDW